jgi:hypothetical protein
MLRYQPDVVESDSSLLEGEMRELLEIIVGMLAAGTCIYVYLKARIFLDERGMGRFRRDPRANPSKVEIQSLFRGNT